MRLLGDLAGTLRNAFKIGRATVDASGMTASRTHALPDKSGTVALTDDQAEWSAETVSQAEAETGNATTRRAWTAQRVRQAIVAWWNSVTSTFGRSFVAAVDAPAGRTALGLGSFATADYAAAPFVNLMPDSGRFAGRINPLTVSTSGSFTSSPFLSAYNGATISNAGKFIFNNNDFGGTAGALTPTVLSFLSAVGRSGDVARYGVEFYICRFLAGSGTALPSTGTDGTTRYLLATNAAKALFAASASATFTAWVRPDSPIHIAVSSFHNGVQKAPNTPISANVWTHVRAISSTLIGYDSAFPRIYAPVGATIDVALPAFFSGIVDTGLHTAPIPTINELSL